MHLHRFPHRDGNSLAELIFESICALMPMRHHTIDPQLSIVERMEAETPVIASDLNSTPELIRHGHNGMLIPVGDTQAAIGAVEELLSDRERARAMGIAAAEEVRTNWSWDRYQKRLIELYESILEKR
ncbi:MAG: glycosyltransferase [Phycisphaeraceae bacterium]|nr:MAG: glycosyltransferase [Phycisphaeraceae bacterium]